MRNREPVSEKQSAANRANAARSTGPRTPQGKSRSSQNARKHGFTGSTYTVVRLEDVDEVANLKSDLATVYQPVNAQEIYALERIALTQHSLLRASRLESGLLTTCLNQTLDASDVPKVMMNMTLAGDGDIDITRAQNRNYLLGEGFHRMALSSNVWSLFMRYQAQAERNYRRAIEEFERIKALREELPEEIPNEPISDPQLEATENSYALLENMPVSLPPHTAADGPGDSADPGGPPLETTDPENPPVAAAARQTRPVRDETISALAEWDIRLLSVAEPVPFTKLNQLSSQDAEPPAGPLDGAS